MNLLEPLTAGVIFFIALLASLQIDAYTAQSSDVQKDRHRFASAADAAMLASQILASNSEPLNPDCNLAASTLAQKINDASVPSGVTRSATKDGLLVRVQVDASNLTRRQRWLSPAAYGLCSHKGTSTAAPG
jgi:hypothetical protein